MVVSATPFYRCLGILESDERRRGVHDECPGPRQDAAEMAATAASVTGTIDEEDRRQRSILEQIQHTLHRYPALGPFIVLVVLVDGIQPRRPGPVPQGRTTCPWSSGR